MEKFKEIPICICEAQTLGNRTKIYKKGILYLHFIYSNAMLLFTLLLFWCCPNHIKVEAQLMFCIACVLYIIIYRNTVK